MKNLISVIRKLLEEYSPLALLALTAPFFLPVDRHLHRTILLLFCAFPGILLSVLNPKVLKKPVHLCILLFVLYFSAQDLRGSLPVAPGYLRQLVLPAVMIIFPAITISYATPDRKLYPSAVRLILFITVLSSIYSLILFYSKNPFPATRLELAFRGSGNPIPDSWKSGFAAVLAGAFFLQSGAKLKRLDWLALTCLPVLMAATLYSHTRSTVLALLAVTAGSLFGIKKRIKKTLLLFATVSITLLLYFASLYAGVTASAPVPAGQAQLKSQSQSPATPLRSAGLAVSGAAGSASIFDRINIWRDHFSRMTSAKIWVTGHGLGRNNFVSEVLPEVQQSYYISPKGFQLHAQSGYVWSLYYGGLIGLGILLILQITAGRNAFFAGYAGYTSKALLVFCAMILLVDTQRLLVGVGSSEYLIFWVPLALAAGLQPAPSEKHQKK